MPYLEIKAYSISQLAWMYEVSKKTLKKWMEPHQEKIGQRIGHFYTAIQVQVIFDALGTPSRSAPFLLTVILNEFSLSNLLYLT